MNRTELNIGTGIITRDLAAVYMHGMLQSCALQYLMIS
jgi:hypothetical protein